VDFLILQQNNSCKDEENPLTLSIFSKVSLPYLKVDFVS